MGERSHQRKLPVVGRGGLGEGERKEEKEKEKKERNLPLSKFEFLLKVVISRLRAQFRLEKEKYK